MAKTPSPTETRLLRCHLSSLLQIKRLERRKDKDRSLCENYRNFDCKPRRISSSASLPPLHKSNYSHLLNDGNGRLRQPCTSDSTNSTPPKENMSTFVATHVFLLSSHMTMSPSDLRLQWTSVNCVCCSCKNSTQPTLPPDVFFFCGTAGFRRLDPSNNALLPTSHVLSSSDFKFTRSPTSEKVSKTSCPSTTSCLTCSSVVCNSIWGHLQSTLQHW